MKQVTPFLETKKNRKRLMILYFIMIPILLATFQSIFKIKYWPLMVIFTLGWGSSFLFHVIKGELRPKKK